MTRQPTDNYLSTFKQAVAKIMHAGIRGMTPHSQAQLTRLLEDNEADDYLSTEFRRAGTEITLYVRFERDPSDHERFRDAEGNMWVTMALHTECNWPSHGSESPACSLARLDLYREVAMLAAEIEAELAPRRGRQIHRMVMTAAEIAEADAKAAAARLDAAYKRVAEARGKGLRPSRGTALTADDIKPLAASVAREVELSNGKRYVIVVSSDATSGTITRTA